MRAQEYRIVELILSIRQTTVRHMFRMGYTRCNICRIIMSYFEAHAGIISQLTVKDKLLAVVNTHILDKKRKKG